MITFIHVSCPFLAVQDVPVLEDRGVALDVPLLERLAELDLLVLRARVLDRLELCNYLQ